MTEMLTQLGANSPAWLLVSILLLAIGGAIIYLFKAFYDSLRGQIERIDEIQREVRADSAEREAIMRDERNEMMKRLGELSGSLSNLTELYRELKTDIREIMVSK